MHCSRAALHAPSHRHWAPPGDSATASPSARVRRLRGVSCQRARVPRASTSFIATVARLSPDRRTRSLGNTAAFALSPAPVRRRSRYPAFGVPLVQWRYRCRLSSLCAVSSYVVFRRHRVRSADDPMSLRSEHISSLAPLRPSSDPRLCILWSLVHETRPSCIAQRVRSTAPTHLPSIRMANPHRCSICKNWSQLVPYPLL